MKSVLTTYLLATIEAAPPWLPTAPANTNRTLRLAARNRHPGSDRTQGRPEKKGAP